MLLLPGLFLPFLLFPPFLCFLAIMYFVPAFVAFSRRHRNKFPIFLLNLFLGWTFLGWIISLVWSFTEA